VKRPRIIIAGAALAALAAAGGITAASAGGLNPTTTASAASTSAAAASVRTASASVAGKTETILITSQGLPLYIYRPDTATRSLVTGGLAQLWPPLTAPAVAGAGLTGKVAVLKDVNGQQVASNGHPLYTFADDQAGQVTGQGVQNFFVATPGIAPIGNSGSAGAASAVPSGGFHY
jgi:predicted lipoprotein with Yx(FWY)xxD motif